jgi:hypothetical protein
LSVYRRRKNIKNYNRISVKITQRHYFGFMAFH